MNAKKSLLCFLSALYFSFLVFIISSCGNSGSQSDDTSLSSTENSSEVIISSDSSSDEFSHTHDWIEVERKEVTCTEDGVITYLCVECEEVKDIVYKEAKGHVEVIQEAVEATCLNTGLTQGSYCDVCDEVLIAQEVIEAKGHIEIIDDAIEATCLNSGLTQGSHCFECGEIIVKQEYVEKKSHEYDEGIYIIEPSCENEGILEFSCINCETKTYAHEDSLGHNYEVFSYSEATCTEDGEIIFKCVNDKCQSKKQQLILSTNHEYSYDNECIKCGYKKENHSHTYYKQIIEPTCTRVGYSLYVCECGDSYKEDFIDQKGHLWDDGTIIKEATCSVEGIIKYQCERCSEYYGKAIPSDHKWNITIITEATCTTPGFSTNKCEYCSKTINEEILPQHFWSDGVVLTEPTCTTSGLEEVECILCGEVKQNTIKPLGHKMMYGECESCGAIIDDLITPNDDHLEYGMYFKIEDIISNYGPSYINEYGVLLDYNEDAIIRKVAVYLTQDGTMWRRAIACVGDNIEYATYVPYLSYDEDIKYTGLNSDWINIFRLSENSDGIWCYNNYVTIGVNLEDAKGRLLLSLYDIGQAGIKTRVFTDLSEMVAWLKDETVCDNHKESEWFVYKEATCCENGQKRVVCDLCGKVIKVETIPMTGTEESDWIIDFEPTCKDYGHKHKECMICHVIVKEEVIPATGEHSLVTEEGRDATCEENGYTSYIYCSVCEEIFSEKDIIYATGHEYNKGICIYCGKENNHTHEWDEGAITKKPTCEKDGITTYTCLTCGETYTESIEASGHIEVIDEAKETTCTEDGLTEGKHCSACNKVLIKQETIPATGHNYEYICDKCGEINKEYYTEGLKFVLSDNNNSYVVSVGTATASDIIIPYIYNGKPVTGINHQGFERCDFIVSVILPNSITRIESLAFIGCGSLIDIDIPDTVSYIGVGAFQACHSLTSFYIPYGVERIEDSTFYDCYELRDIEIPDSVISIGDSAFRECISLESVIIPNNVTEIEQTAFYNCSSLTDVEISINIKVISNDTFGSCGSLTSVSIPEGVTTIGNQAFHNCTSLTSVYIPKSVIEISSGAFSICNNLVDVFYSGTKEEWEKINIEEDGNEILSYLTIHYNGEEKHVHDDNYICGKCGQINETYYSEGLEFVDYGFYYGVKRGTATDENLIIPSIYNGRPVTRISNMAFFEFYSLKTVVIPDSITSIGELAFYLCTSLTDVNLPEGLVEIEDSAFGSCMALKSITIPNSVTSLGEKIFNGCSLENVTIGNGVTFLDSHALSGNDFESIEIPSSVTGIGESAFSNCHNLKAIIIPDNVTRIGTNAFSYCDSLETVNYSGTKKQWNDIKINSGNDSLLNAIIICTDGIFNDPSIIPQKLVYQLSGDGSYYSVIGIGTTTDSNVVVPSEYEGLPVKRIGAYAFNQCMTIKVIQLPSTIEVIEEGAFYYCESLEYIYLSEGIREIKDYAFSSCVSLKEIAIPDSVIILQGAPFGGCTSLKTVSLSKNITKIDSYAFSNCSSLTNITIPDGVTYLGTAAFYGCESLTELYIPSSVISIDLQAFYGCSSLEKITVDNNNSVFDSRNDCNAIIETNTNKLIAGCKNTIIPNGVIHIGDYAFAGSVDLQSINIPDSIISLGYGSFMSCTSLKTIKLTNNLTGLGEMTFYECSSLTAFEVPSGVEILESNLFFRCNNLKEIYIPKSVKTIKYSVFYECYSLEKIYYSGTQSEWENIKINSGNDELLNTEKIFEEDTGETQQKLNYKLSSDGTYYSVVGKGNETSNDIVIPLTYHGLPVKKIAEEAFSQCTSITSVVIGNNVTSIGAYAFNCCRSLTSVELPNNLAKIDDHTFAGCWDLTNVIIPESVTSIGNYAFYSCLELTNIQIPINVTTIGNYAFSSCTSLESIIIPEKVYDIGCSLFSGCHSLENITVNSYNRYYDSRNNCNAIIESATNVLIQGCYNTTIPSDVIEIGNAAFSGLNSITRFNIPNNIIRIGKDAFAYCEELTCVSIPYGVTNIGEGAFQWCIKLNDVILPESISTIEDSVFAACSSLNNISIPKSVTKIGPNAFKWCNSFSHFSVSDGVRIIDACAFYGCKNLKTVDFGCNVEKIGTLAFHDCGSLTTLYIPVSVATIYYDSFNYCTSLKDVYYGGTEEQWLKIEHKQSPCQELLSATIHFAEEEKIYVNIDTSAVTVFTEHSNNNIILADWTVAYNDEGRVIYASKTSPGYGGPADWFYHDGTYVWVPGQICGIFDLDPEFNSWPNVTEDGRNAWLLYSVVVPDGVTILTGNEASMMPILKAIFGLDEVTQQWLENSVDDGEYNHVVVNQS